MSPPPPPPAIYPTYPCTNLGKSQHAVHTTVFCRWSVTAVKTAPPSSSLQPNGSKADGDRSRFVNQQDTPCCNEKKASRFIEWTERLCVPLSQPLRTHPNVAKNCCTDFSNHAFRSCHVLPSLPIQFPDLDVQTPKKPSFTPVQTVPRHPSTPSNICSGTGAELSSPGCTECRGQPVPGLADRQPPVASW